MEAQSNPRRSRAAVPGAVAALVMALTSASAFGEKSGKSPRASIARRASDRSWLLPVLGV